MLFRSLSIIPYFFYDLTTEKHKFIIEELKKRAALEEANGDAHLEQVETTLI